MNTRNFNPSRATFLLSSPKWKALPDFDKPAIVVAGRSNVGKSSFINMILRRKNIARISSTPGRTQMLNFFDIDEKLLLVDVPGYGFAKAPKDTVKQWTDNLVGFIEGAKGLSCVLQLMDIRREPTKDDIWFAGIVRSAGLELQVIITKADKISRGHRVGSAGKIKKALGVTAPPIITSAKEGQGRDEVWKRIFEIVSLDKES